MRTMLAFFAVCLLLIAAFGYTIYQQFAAVLQEEETLRSPAAQQSVEMIKIEVTDNDDEPAEPSASNLDSIRPHLTEADNVAVTRHLKFEAEAAQAAENDTASPRAPGADVVWAGEQARSLRTLADRIARERDTEALDEALGRTAARGDSTAGRNLLTAWCAAWPEDSGRRFELVGMLMRAALFSEALEHLVSLTERDPHDHRAWHNRAIAHQALGQLTQAENAWTRLLELRPDSVDARAYRGEVRLDRRDYAAAADDLRSALTSDPGAVDVALNLSLALESLGDFEAALAAARQAIDHAPQLAEGWRRAGRLAWLVFEQTGDAERRREAIALWLNALSLDPDQPEVLAALEAAGPR